MADAAAAEIRRDASFFGSQWNEATVYGDLGRFYGRAGRNRDAETWLEKSCARWGEVKVSKWLDPRRQRELASAEAELAAVRKAIRAQPLSR
jgi:hypothetical protein